VIKAVAERPGGRAALILGLSHENVKRLMDGKPIHFEADQLGLDKWDVIIFVGETEQAMEEDLKGMLRPRQ
jgi:hypothetical protein